MIPQSYTHEEVNNYLTIEGLNSFHLQTAEEFHSDSMDNFDLTGIDAYNGLVAQLLIDSKARRLYLL